MCPCSLLLFVHIWKYFNSYMQCCFQHLVYKIWIKMGKYWVNLMTPRTCPGVHMHQTRNIHCQHLMHLTELMFIHLVYIISQLQLKNISGFTPLLVCSDAALSWTVIHPVPIYPHHSYVQWEIQFILLYHSVLFPAGSRKCTLQF